MDEWVKHRTFTQETGVCVPSEAFCYIVDLLFLDLVDFLFSSVYFQFSVALRLGLGKKTSRLGLGKKTTWLGKEKIIVWVKIDHFRTITMCQKGFLAESPKG